MHNDHWPGPHHHRTRNPFTTTQRRLLLRITQSALSPPEPAPRHAELSPALEDRASRRRPEYTVPATGVRALSAEMHAWRRSAGDPGVKLSLPGSTLMRIHAHGPFRVFFSPPPPPLPPLPLPFRTWRTPARCTVAFRGQTKRHSAYRSPVTVILASLTTTHF